MRVRYIKAFKSMPKGALQNLADEDGRRLIELGVAEATDPSPAGSPVEPLPTDPPHVDHPVVPANKAMHPEQVKRKSADEVDDLSDDTDEPDTHPARKGRR